MPVRIVVMIVVVLAAVVGPASASAQTPRTAQTAQTPPGSTTRSSQVTPREGQAAKARLDARRAQVPAEVTAWWIDPATHQTVVAVVGPESRAARDFAADENPAAVRLQPMSAPVRPLDATPLVGGTAITTAGVRCSVGWSVRRGPTTYVLTAGHCTREGATWAGADRRTVGTVVRTRYPTEDYGVIEVTDPTAWRGSGLVEGGPTVTGSAPAVVGNQVCRSGSTSGYHCGVIEATDATVNYGSGLVVQGLTRTTACAEPGDSGGSVVAPATAQAQGTLSGGSGDCTTGGTSYFEPLAPLLTRFGYTLVTGS